MVQVTVTQDYGVNIFRLNVHRKPRSVIQHGAVIKQNLRFFRPDRYSDSAYFPGSA
jgi:hypothetical protein